MLKIKSRVKFLKTINSLKIYIHIPIIEPLSTPVPPPKSCHLPKLQHAPIFLSNPHSDSFDKARIALDKVHKRPYNLEHR